MKKYLSLLLALLLVCSFSVPALADLYEEYGPMWEWTEEQTETSESWTDEQWDEYYAGEDAYYRNLSRLANADAKRLLGCPYPEGPNLKINDTFVNFGPDNAPYYEDGDIMLPVRALSEWLQAELTYDNATKKATLALPDGPTLQFAVGSTKLNITEDGLLRELEMWYEPELRAGKMYAPVEVLVEGLGYTENWDYYYEISYLIDAEALVGSINNRFTIYNSILAGSYRPNARENVQQKGTLTLSGTLYGEEKHDTVSAGVDYELLQHGENFAGSFQLKLDLSQMEDSIFSFLDELDWQTIRQISSAKGQFIYNSSTDTLYLQSNLLALMDESLTETDWLAIGGVLQAASGQMEALTIGDLAYSMAGSNYYVDDIYAEVQNTATVLELICGDANFKETTSGQTTTYTLQTNTTALQKALTEDQQYYLQSTLSPISSLFSLIGYYPATGSQDGLPAFDHKLVLKKTEGELTHFSMDTTLATKGTLPARLAVQVAAAPEKTTVSIAYAGRYFGKLEITGQSTTEASSTLPATAPPADATVITLDDLYYPYYYDDYYYEDYDYEYEDLEWDEDEDYDTVTPPADASEIKAVSTK